MRSPLRFLPHASLSLALFATGACNAIFGVEGGVLTGTGGVGTSSGSTGSGGTSTSSTSSTMGTGGTGTSSSAGSGGPSTSASSATGSSSSTGTGGGGSCTPNTATCTDAVLQPCDGNGHLSTPVTCDVVAACDAAAQKCIDGATFGRLSIGHGRACAIDDNRNVRCWGDNENGTLVGDDPHDMVPVAEVVTGLADARQVSVTLEHGCVLQDDGTVTCWGGNYDGELGFQEGGPQPPAGVPSVKGAVEVRTSPACSCARLASGDVQCWGKLDDGCLGTASQQQGSQPIPTSIGVTGAVQLSMADGGEPACVRLAAGGVTCWSDLILPTPIPGSSGAVDVQSAFGFVFMRTATQVLWSAPKSDNSGWTTPVAYVGLPAVTAIAGGNDFCGLRGDGVVLCALLDGHPPPDSAAPLPGQPAGTVVEIAGGTSESYGNTLSCLRLSGPIAGNVYCWGDDLSGALGAGAPEDVTTPAPVTLPALGAATLAAGEMSTFAVLAGGGVMYWGDNEAFGLANTVTPAAVGALGTDNVAVINDDYLARAYVIKKAGAPLFYDSGTEKLGARLLSSGYTDFVDAHLGDKFDIGLRAGGQVVAYAETTAANQSGILGNGSLTATPGPPTTVAGVSASAMAAWSYPYDPSLAHVCVILNATGGVLCWGRNDDGELGSGVPSQTPVTTPTAVAIPGNEAVVSLATGSSFTCAATASGKVYCWGDNSLGQLGQPAGGSSAAPVLIGTLAGVAGVTATDSHACAWLSSTGTVACWGQNDLGELGDGSFDQSPSGPVPVTGLSGIVQVSAGTDHTCARKADGSVTCWGSSYNGQVGTGKMGLFPKPLVVQGL